MRTTLNVIGAVPEQFVCEIHVRGERVAAWRWDHEEAILGDVRYETVRTGFGACGHHVVVLDIPDDTRPGDIMIWARDGFGKHHGAGYVAKWNYRSVPEHIAVTLFAAVDLNAPDLVADDGPPNYGTYNPTFAKEERIRINSAELRASALEKLTAEEAKACGIDERVRVDLLRKSAAGKLTQDERKACGLE